MAHRDGVIAAWVEEQLDESPVEATAVGAPGRDDRLADLSAKGYERRHEADRHWAARLEALVGPDATTDERIDILLVLSALAKRAAFHEWGQWRRDPSAYVDECVHGIYGLFHRRLRPDAELVAAAAARMVEIPVVVAAAKANLDPDVAPALLVRRGVRAAAAGASFLRDGLASWVEDPDLAADLAGAGTAAAAHLDDLASHLDDLAGRCHGDWRIGEATYDAVLRDGELLGFATTELHARGLVAWNELDQEMRGLASALDPTSSGWFEVVSALAHEHPADADAMRDAYAAECERARTFLLDRELVTLPEGERCDVVPSPVFLRPLLAVASYSQPPSFTPSRVGTFYVPYPPEGTSDDEMTQRLEDNGFHAIPTVTVHEAYPGHHWHLSFSAANPRPARKLVTTPYFIEGWALYAEKMMREQGYFSDPRDELCHLDQRLFRAARIVVDTALHTGEMSVEAAIEHMSTKASLSRAVATAEVERYCSWPTQAPSYLTGALEIERLRDRWMGEGRGDLRSFHDTVAAAPGMPLSLVELAAFAD